MITDDALPQRFRPLRGMGLWLCLALIIAAIGLAGVAALAPTLGLGRDESFLLYRWAGLSRRDLVIAALRTILLTGTAGALLIATLPRFAGPAGALVQKAARLISHRHAHRDWVTAAALIPAALFLIIFWWSALDGPVFVAPDSGTYLSFSSVRTLGYGLFLRLAATITDSAQGIILIQLLLGTAATIFFAESVQRLTRNYLISIPLGLFLLFNWPLYEHAIHLLSDYPFFASLCFHLGCLFLALDQPSRTRLLLLALSIFLAIWIRPVGIFLIIAAPVLLLSRPQAWRAISVWFIGGTAILLILQCALNAAVFGYFGLSRFSGWLMSVNAYYVLKPDTPFEYPELIRRLSEMAAPRQAALAAISNREARKTALIEDTNPIMGDGGVIIHAFLKDHPEIKPELSDIRRHLAFGRFFNDLSPLNRRIGEIGIGAGATHLWWDALQTRLAWAAFRHNPVAAADLFWLKFWPTLFDQYTQVYYYPIDLQGQFSTYYQFAPSKTGIGWGNSPTGITVTERSWLNGRPFYAVNAAFYAAANLPLPLIGYMSGLVAIATGMVLLHRRRPVPAALAMQVYAFLFVLGYAGAVCFGHVPIGRYLVVSLPAALLLLFGPVQLLAWLSSRFVSRPRKLI